MYKQWNSKSPVEWFSNEIESRLTKLETGSVTLQEVIKDLQQYKEYAKSFEQDQCVEFMNVVFDNHYKCINQIKDTYYYKSESDVASERIDIELWNMYKSKQLL